MFAGSLIDSAHNLKTSLESGQFDIPPPADAVASWPVVGERVYEQWSAAAANFEDWLEDNSEQIKALVEGALGRAAGIGIAILQFMLATLIAAAMLANDESTKTMLRRFFRRLAGDRADEMIDLSAATIRSVAMARADSRMTGSGQKRPVCIASSVSISTSAKKIESNFAASARFARSA